MLKMVEVNLGDRSYQIVFEKGFTDLIVWLKEKYTSTKFLIVTDSHVKKYYADELQQQMNKAHLKAEIYAFKAGEQQKKLNTIREIYDICIKNKCDRSSVIIALGGGVTGDIAGFAAATFMRGIEFIQVPTSLLAQVDSSVGGKVGVDYNGSKNIIGAFYQPKRVYMNIETLRTLPKREFAAGLAEVIKHGIIYDATFFEKIEKNIEALLALDADVLTEVIKRNCEIKANVVAQDEKEHGLRAILNFGHTIGHGIESASNFELLHGECVAIGINAVFFIAYHKNMIPKSQWERIIRLLEFVGLPITAKNINKKEVYQHMLQDKKRDKNQLKFILPHSIGKVVQTTDVSEEEIFAALEYVQ